MVTSTKQSSSTTTPTTNPAFDMPSIEEATQQMRELTERTIESSKSAALAALDAFEKAFQGLGDLEQKAASATRLDWVNTAGAAHAKFVADVSGPYTTAVRDLLK